MAGCHCLRLNETVASFKWNYPVSLSKDRHIFRSREHETRVPRALFLPRCVATKQRVHPRPRGFAINLDSTPSGCNVQELIRRASTILSCDRTFRETSRWWFPSDSLPSFRVTISVERKREKKKNKKRRLLSLSFLNGSVSWIIDQAPRSSSFDQWMTKDGVERISKEGCDYFSTPFFPGIHIPFSSYFRRSVTFFFSLDDSSPFIYI